MKSAILSIIASVVFFTLGLVTHIIGDGSIESKLDELMFVLGGFAWAIISGLDIIRQELDALKDTNKQTNK